MDYTYASNSVNAYTDITPGSYDPNYNLAGNLTRDKDGYNYVYDYENRLILIYIDVNADSDYDSGTDTLKATFAYDALGRRIEKVDSIAGTTTRYYYDDQRIALQRMASGGTETDDRYFVYGNYIDEVLLMANCSPLMAGDYYYGHDHLYSPVGLFAQSGSMCERYEYDAYGMVRVMWTSYLSRTASIYGNPFYFTGRELDGLVNNFYKLYYYRARSYDPQTGRFLQRDPAQYADGMNLYEYVRSNSIQYVDSLGLGACPSMPDLPGYLRPTPFPGPKLSSPSPSPSIPYPGYTPLPEPLPEPTPSPSNPGVGVGVGVGEGIGVGIGEGVGIGIGGVIGITVGVTIGGVIIGDWAINGDRSLVELGKQYYGSCKRNDQLDKCRSAADEAWAALQHINNGWPNHPEYGTHLDSALRQWETGIPEGADHLNEVKEQYNRLKNALEELMRKDCWNAGSPNGRIQKRMENIINVIKDKKMIDILEKISRPNPNPGGAIQGF